MKTKNKIISIAMCLCLALLSGCSQGDGGQQGTGTAGGVSTPAAGNAGGNTENGGANTEAGTDNVNTSSNGENVTTEQGNKPTDEKFAYLDLLKEEYEKCGRLYGLGAPSCVNGKIIMPPYEDANCKNKDMVIYDVGKKETREITFKTDYGRYSGFAYDDKNGYIYGTFYGGDGTTLYKFDISGNLISQSEPFYYVYGESKAALFPDGTFFIGNDSMYSPDWKTVTELPILQAEVEHGIKKDVKNYEILAKYNNKVYAASFESDTEGLYCLNIDTMTWEEVQIQSDLKEILYTKGSDYYYNHINLFATNIVGRYWFISGSPEGERKRSTMVYDMETDTVIATTIEGNMYRGINYELGLRNGVLTKNQYPGDGSEIISETVLDTGDKKLNFTYFNNPVAVVPFDEQYYVYRDDYGIFLREYGKGEDGEITVLMREQ